MVRESVDEIKIAHHYNVYGIKGLPRIHHIMIYRHMAVSEMYYILSQGFYQRLVTKTGAALVFRWKKKIGRQNVKGGGPVYAITAGYIIIYYDIVSAVYPIGHL